MERKDFNIKFCEYIYPKVDAAIHAAMHKIAQESQKFHLHNNACIIYQDAIADFLNSLENDLNNVAIDSIKKFAISKARTKTYMDC